MNMRQPFFSMPARPQPATLAGRRVLVLGLGDTGLSVADWVRHEGGEVRVADTRAAPPGANAFSGELHTGKFKPSLLKNVDLVCVSPGLSLQEEIVQTAIARNIPIAGDIELFAWNVRAHAAEKVLAITGTNGKSTVTALTGHLLRAAGVDAEVAGNIGPPALIALIALVKRGRQRPAVWVLELSSYQLETTWALEPDAAALLNVSEDHLDRYGGLAAYAEAKARIFLGRGAQVLNRCDSASMALATGSEMRGRVQVTFGMDAPPVAEDFGIAHAAGRAWLARGGEQILAVDELPLAGAHNASNALAACALAHLAGAPLAALADGLRSFRGLPHRMQRVALRGGVEWFDDSKGTNVGATVAALNGLAPALGGLPRKAVLILGGDGKGQNFAPLAPAIRAHVKHVLLIGRDAALIEQAIAAGGVPTERMESMEKAVLRAAQVAAPGDAVLLSPACASFDMFRDYKHRGEVFAAAVDALNAFHRGAKD